jgi:hypothetical protein
VHNVTRPDLPSRCKQVQQEPSRTTSSARRQTSFTSCCDSLAADRDSLRTAMHGRIRRLLQFPPEHRPVATSRALARPSTVTIVKATEERSVRPLTIFASPFSDSRSLRSVAPAHGRDEDDDHEGGRPSRRRPAGSTRKAHYVAEEMMRCASCRCSSGLSGARTATEKEPSSTNTAEAKSSKQTL